MITLDVFFRLNISKKQKKNQLCTSGLQFLQLLQIHTNAFLSVFRAHGLGLLLVLVLHSTISGNELNLIQSSLMESKMTLLVSSRPVCSDASILFSVHCCVLCPLE